MHFYAQHTGPMEKEKGNHNELVSNKIIWRGQVWLSGWSSWACEAYRNLSKTGDFRPCLRIGAQVDGLEPSFK